MKLLALTSCLLPLLRIYAILPISLELPFRLVGGMIVGEEWSEMPSLEWTQGRAEPWTRVAEVSVLAETAKYPSMLARSARLQIFATKNTFGRQSLV